MLKIETSISRFILAFFLITSCPDKDTLKKYWKMEIVEFQSTDIYGNSRISSLLTSIKGRMSKCCSWSFPLKIVLWEQCLANHQSSQIVSKQTDSSIKFLLEGWHFNHKLTSEGKWLNILTKMFPSFSHHTMKNC